MGTESEVGPTKECPWCAERILAKAIVCRYCGRDLPADTSGPRRITSSGSAHVDETPAAPPAGPDTVLRPARPVTVPNRPVISGLVARAESTGIRDWLAIFAFSAIVYTVTAVVSLWSDITEVMTWSVRGLVFDPSILVAVLVWDSSQALLAAAFLLLIVLMFLKNPLTPRIARLVLIASPVSALAIVGAASVIAPHLPAGSTELRELPNGQRVVQALVGSMIWFAYWRKSKLVQRTFGSNGGAGLAFTQSARKSARRAAFFCFGGVALVAAAALAFGFSQARSIGAAAGAPSSSPDEKFDADAVFAKSIRAQSGNYDSLLRAHDANDSTWLQNLSASAVVTHLTDAERREVAQIRTLLLDRLDVDHCAQYVLNGSGANTTVLTAAENRRAIELTGIAVGRLISGWSSSRTGKVDDETIGAILRRNATPEDLKVLEASSSSTSTAEQCAAGKLVYRIVLDLPAGSSESSDAVFWILDTISGRE